MNILKWLFAPGDADYEQLQAELRKTIPAIRTVGDLRDYVTQLLAQEAKRAQQRSLEHYLRALLRRIEADQDHQPTYQDLARFLTDSLSGSPAPYPWQSGAFPETQAIPNSPEYHQEIRTYDYVERQLKWRITQLRRSSRRYTVASFLEESIDGLENYNPDDEEWTVCDWTTLDHLFGHAVSRIVE